MVRLEVVAIKKEKTMQEETKPSPKILDQTQTQTQTANHAWEHSGPQPHKRKGTSCAVS